jgi:hypothetical protein
VEGGLDEPEEPEEPELDDPPVDVEPEEPDELVGELEEPDELVGGLEVVGGEGGGARRSIGVFTDPLNEEVTVTNTKATSVRRKRMFYIDRRISI